MTVAAEHLAVKGAGRRSHFVWAISDTLTITQRNLITLVRLPQLLVFSTIQPVIFVLLFVFVFGGAIGKPGGLAYVDYLMPGIFVQTVTFGAVNTGVGLAEDLHKGLVERFRSLPMARSAVLAGRTLSDLVRDVFVVALMLVVGYIVGFRIHASVFDLVVAMVILLFFAFALAWVFALLGMTSSSAETAQAAAFPIVAVLVFASPAFVPVDSMPYAWLRVFANHQPVGATVNAVRGLLLHSVPRYGQLVWSYPLQSVLWSIVIIALFAPIAVRVYRKAH